MGKEQALKHMREDASSAASSSSASEQNQSLGAQLKSLFSCASSKNGDDGSQDSEQGSGSGATNSNANRHVLKPESPARQLWCSISLLLSVYYLCIVPFRIGFMTAGTCVVRCEGNYLHHDYFSTRITKPFRVDFRQLFLPYLQKI